jgi:hypothetical protein
MKSEVLIDSFTGAAEWALKALWLLGGSHRVFWPEDAAEIAIRRAGAVPTLHGPVLNTGGQLP